MLLFEIFLPVLFENNENVSLQWIDTINRAGKKEKKKKEKKKLIAISLSYPLSLSLFFRDKFINHHSRN